MKKTLIASVVALSSLTTLQAYDDGCCGGSCYNYGVNPPTIFDPCGITGSISYLYWKPYQDNGAFANIITPVDGDIDNLQSDTIYNADVQTRLKDPDYQWDSGFQVSVGYLLPCDRWGISLEWTHYETDVSTQATVSPGYILSPFVYAVGYPTEIGETFQRGEAHSEWKLQFNQLDINFSREFYVGKCMTITPFVGLRALWIRNTNRIVTEANSIQGLDTFNDTLTSNLESDFKSLGLNGGLQSFYEIGCGIGVYGDFGASLVYGCYDAFHRITAIREDVGSDIDVGSNFLSYDRNVLRATLDLSLGLKWMTDFNCNKGQVYVQLGWDHHLYFNQNSFLSLIQTEDQLGLAQERNSNLYLYGLKFEIGAAF